MEVQQKQQKKKKEKKIFADLNLKLQSKSTSFFIMIFEVAGLRAAPLNSPNERLQSSEQPVQSKPGILGFVSVTGKDEIPMAQGNMTA